MLAAPDKFRGTATAIEVAAAIADAARVAGASCVELAMADGGEGTLAALGGPNRTSLVTGPLGDPVDAPWRLVGSEAVIEMACASGLALVGGATGNDPIAASTSGTGELITQAAESGARRIVVGVGGSATTDVPTRCFFDVPGPCSAIEPQNSWPNTTLSCDRANPG